MSSEDNIDKDLQEWLDKKTEEPAAAHNYNKADADTYRALFNILKEPSASQLSFDISDAVVAELKARRDRIIDFRWYIMLTLMLLVFAGISYFAVIYLNSESAAHLLQLFLKFKWVIAFVISCYFIIQYFDNRLVNKMF